MNNVKHFDHDLFQDLAAFLYPTQKCSLNDIWKKVKNITIDGVLQGQEVEYAIYSATIAPNLPPIIIVDIEKKIDSKNQQLALTEITDEEIYEAIRKSLPKKALSKINEILREHGIEDGIQVGKNLAKSKVFYIPIQSLKDAEILNQIDWEKFIHELISWKCNKDPRLVKIFTPILLKGLHPRINPNLICDTNSGTGKTLTMDMIGIRIGRATPKSMTGFARSPEEVFEGTLHQAKLSVAFDQFESNDLETFRFMYNLLESGEETISIGATLLTTTTSCTVVILANPSSKLTPSAGFAEILDKIAENNVSMGRRFGLLAYGNDFSTIKPSKDLVYSNWGNAIKLFRAVEEKAKPGLDSIMNEERIWDWLNLPIHGYYDSVKEPLDKLGYSMVKQFLLEHGKTAHTRIRGAAFYTSIVLHLRAIALNEYSIEQIIQTAEESLIDIIEINLESIHKICSNYEHVTTYRIQTFYKNLHKFYQEIVQAVLLYKAEYPSKNNFLLSEIQYQPEEQKTYNYFSKSIDRLGRTHDLEKHNQQFSKYLGFRIVKLQDNEYRIQLMDDILTSCIELKGRIIK